MAAVLLRSFIIWSTEVSESGAMSAKVRLMNPQDIERVLHWRNHPDVRQFMYTRQEIGLKEHTRWFECASRDASRQLLIFEWAGEPLGFINLHAKSPGGVAEWGFYVAPGAPKGVGRRLGEAALQHAFSQANLHKVSGQALAYNERSLRFHRNLGFKQEGVLRDQHFDGQRYHDVVCFGLLAAEWAAHT